MNDEIQSKNSDKDGGRLNLKRWNYYHWFNFHAVEENYDRYSFDYSECLSIVMHLANANSIR